MTTNSDRAARAQQDHGEAHHSDKPKGSNCALTSEHLGHTSNLVKARRSDGESAISSLHESLTDKENV